MKKSLLSLMLLSSIGIFSAHAQITLNSTDVVDMGDMVEQATDTLPGGITIGAAGTAQTWNFSTINEDELDTSFFQDPSTLPGNADFPLSNLGMTNASEDSAWYFLTKNTLALVINGVHQMQGGNGVSIPVTTTIVTFPSTIGTNFGSSWSAPLGAFPLGQDLDGPFPQGVIDSLKITRTATLTSNIDAWGDVTTPLGTFPSLRQIVIEETIDTTWQLEGGVWSIISFASLTGLSALGVDIDDVTYDTTRTARWWTNDPSARFPLVEMDYEANGAVNSIDWLKATPTTVSVLEKANLDSKVSLFPNPAKNNVTISTLLTENDNIKIFDVTGKLVKTERFNTNTISLSVSDFNNGLYFYNITDVNGNIIHSNKFVVAK
ncbi:T9SS type A sorting domain-containing protein [Vicingaceae bacterium]|nr:T9SS type A sorting domain-containing protein [Vicingaceae bacterium]